MTKSTAKTLENAPAILHKAGLMLGISREDLLMSELRFNIKECRHYCTKIINAFKVRG